MIKREFKYYPKDFGKLSVKVQHMDLDFDVYDTHTKVVSNFKAKVLDNPISEILLNANNLEIHGIRCDKREIEHTYKKDDDIIVVKFKKPIPAGTKFTITTETTCKPTKNVLEGLYYDETPDGCPPTMITQCQQWGFQRIVPCVDDMTAKCTYCTKITANNQYTNIITNGDLVKDREKAGKGRVSVKYDNTITPMATYLFFLGAGTYATFTKELEYPDGSTFMLELLVPPNSDEKIANHALDVLADSILWIRLFTGPNKYENEHVSRQIWELIKERDQFKKFNKNASAIRENIKKLAKPLHLGYKYTGTVYREIGMQNSDFGGMENVGNTTITTNRIMPFPEMSDGSFEYMIDVKVHEFYHNLNGSEVTGRSPFEIWLNEAVTVYIEREFFSFVAGENYARLGEVLGILSPGNGTLALDSGVGCMPIEPDGFNDCNELITGVTYVKAPEFVKMIKDLMGKEKFVKGLDLYHTKYKHGNASRAQWIEAMEEASGLDFKKMAQQWLKQKGHPIVKVTSSYDAEKKECTLTLKQEGKQVWEFPFPVAYFDQEGKIVEEKTHRVMQKEENIVFTNVPEAGFISLARGFSFFGKVKHHANEKELLLQIRKDTDVVNRYMAFYELFDREKTKLLKDKDAVVNEDLVDLYFKLLTNKELMEDVSSQFLAIFESVEDETYTHRYQDLYKMKNKLMKAIALKYEKELKEMYADYASKEFNGAYLERKLKEIRNRQVKNTCLGLLYYLDTPEIHALIKKQFENPTAATDEISAFRMYLNSSASDKLKVLDTYEKKARESLVSWEAFLYVVGGNDSKDALEIIKRIEDSKDFRIEQSNDQRALYGSFAGNRKKSLQTEEGRQFLQEMMVKLTKVNEYTVGRMLTIFGHVDKMEEKYYVPVVSVLVNVLKELNVKDTPSVFNTLKRILAGLPKAVGKYEAEKGNIEILKN